MAVGKISVTGSISGLGSGSKIVGPVDVITTTPVAQTTSIILASGFNSIAVPTGSDAVMIVTPVGNTATVILKGVTGDTGIQMAKAGVTLIQFDSAAVPATIGLTSSALQSTATEILFM